MRLRIPGTSRRLRPSRTRGRPAAAPATPLRSPPAKTAARSPPARDLLGLASRKWRGPRGKWRGPRNNGGEPAEEWRRASRKMAGAEIEWWTWMRVSIWSRWSLSALPRKKPRLVPGSGSEYYGRYCCVYGGRRRRIRLCPWCCTQLYHS
eukprot:3315946-Rhodomonas_salina.1